MRTVGALATVMAIVLGRSPARADVVLPFNLLGLFIYTQSGPSQIPFSVTATLLIDTTIGSVLDLQSSSLPKLVSPTQGPVAGAGTYIWSASTEYVPGGLRLVFDTSSLVGYTGGQLVGVNDPDLKGNFTQISEVHVPPQVLVSGSVTPLAVPEPSSFAILAATGLGLLTLRRLRTGSFVRSDR